MTEQQAEALQNAFTSMAMQTCPHEIVRGESRLFDYCLAAGMSFDEPDHIEWASSAINTWMGEF